MITNYDTKERLEQLEKLAPIREKEFKNLQRYRKVRIDQKTVVLVPPEKMHDYETQMDSD